KKQVGEDTPALPDLGASKREEAKAAEGANAASPQRLWSVFSRGWDLLRSALAVGVLMLGSWQPEPWPDAPSQGLPATPAARTAEAKQAGTQARGQPARACSTAGTHESDSS